MDEPGAEGIAVLDQHQEALHFDLRVKRLQVDCDQLGTDFVEHVPAIHHVHLPHLRRQLCQRLKMRNFGVFSQVLAELSHLSGWLHAVNLTAVAKHFGECHSTRAQARPKVQERCGIVAVEHFLDLIEYSVCDCVGPWASVEQIGDNDVLGVLDLLLDGILVDLPLLLPLLEHLLLAGEVNLLDLAVKGQLLLQLFEVELREEVVVDLLLVVPEFHEIGEMEGDVSELLLVVFVEDLLDVLHVLIGQKLLN